MRSLLLFVFWCDSPSASILDAACTQSNSDRAASPIERRQDFIARKATNRPIASVIPNTPAPIAHHAARTGSSSPRFARRGQAEGRRLISAICERRGRRQRPPHLNRGSPFGEELQVRHAEAIRSTEARQRCRGSGHCSHARRPSTAPVRARRTCSELPRSRRLRGGDRCASGDGRRR
jgi:hypothetical protein